MCMQRADNWLFYGNEEKNSRDCQTLKEAGARVKDNISSIAE